MAPVFLHAQKWLPDAASFTWGCYGSGAGFAIGGARPSLCRLQSDGIADPCGQCYRKIFHRPHPDWGNGSLLAAVRSNPLLNEPNLANAQYCHCLELVFAALRQWRLAQLNRMRSPRIIAQLD